MVSGAHVVSRRTTVVDDFDELSSGVRHVARIYDEVERREKSW